MSFAAAVNNRVVGVCTYSYIHAEGRPCPPTALNCKQMLLKTAAKSARESGHNQNNPLKGAKQTR